ncbi:transposase [Deinococcus cellulosilyticus]|uniref:Insertion element IS402-like domain-containing protein n=1 Tax=Deinococcus cellulosilyticus (strain DSM 18568 / NBRC 106333 / KACC 11606 / 5516J-15) TaxID=1223518 RepID=A0A511MYI9_DEIC1|nr:transposase [Deinococcus cellulosilyticus]GEM45660.1 hypothetical protein DC3_12950 [Deinococcus cellulosilyticus NBRC 106333 = KACC 11606]
MPAPHIYHLQDQQWDHMLLGIPRLAVKDRRVFEAILHVLSTALPWDDLPEDFGITSRTAWNRYQKWQREGLWEDVLSGFLGSCDATEQQLWLRRLQEAALQRTHKYGTRKRPLLAEH